MYDCGDYGEQYWLMRSLFICRNWAGEEYSSMLTMQSIPPKSHAGVYKEDTSYDLVKCIIMGHSLILSGHDH